jgi:hypothetical protein
MTEPAPRQGHPRFRLSKPPGLQKTLGVKGFGFWPTGHGGYERPRGL